jgi:hypothetical protein
MAQAVAVGADEMVGVDAAQPRGELGDEVHGSIPNRRRASANAFSSCQISLGRSVSATTVSAVALSAQPTTTDSA